MGVYAHSISAAMPRDATDAWIESTVQKRRAEPKKRGPRRKKSGRKKPKTLAARSDCQSIVTLTVAFLEVTEERTRKIEQLRQDLGAGFAKICGGAYSRQHRQVGPTRLEWEFEVKPYGRLSEASILRAMDGCGAQVVAAVSRDTEVSENAAENRLGSKEPDRSEPTSIAAPQRENAGLQAEVARLKEQNRLLMAAIAEAGQALRKQANREDQTLASREARVSDEPQAPTRRPFRTPF